MLQIEANFLQIEANFLQIEAHFLQIEAHFLQLEAHYLQIEAHFLQIETYFLQLEAHFLQIEAHFLHIEAHFLQIEAHFLQIEAVQSVLGENKYWNKEICICFLCIPELLYKYCSRIPEVEKLSSCVSSVTSKPAFFTSFVNYNRYQNIFKNYMNIQGVPHHIGSLLALNYDFCD